MNPDNGTSHVEWRVIEADRKRGPVFVDRTHMRRRASGIERITDALFSDQALAPLRVKAVNSPGGWLPIVLNQMLRVPTTALLNPRSVWAFPGYPPSPVFVKLRERAVLYVHDLFLMTREQDLNRSAKVYAARLFHAAVRGMRYFFVNSEATGAQLAAHVAADAEILSYRPKVANVFSLTRRVALDEPERPLIVGVVGTIEPRKNFLAGARICGALAQKLGRPVEFHVVGRTGWGDDAASLARLPYVRLHGFLDGERASAVIGSFDLFLFTSHEEGLGLPLLEVQYAGLPVVAPDQAVFREVLGASGHFISPEDTNRAAETIVGILNEPGWREREAAAASANIAYWNSVAEGDREAAVELLWRLGASRVD